MSSAAKKKNKYRVADLVVLLVVSSITVIAARQSISRIHGRMFGLEPADLSRAYFQYLAQYKIAIIVFSLTPYIALKLMA